MKSTKHPPRQKALDGAKLQIFCAALQGLIAGTASGDHSPDILVPKALRFTEAGLAALESDGQN